MSSKYNNTTGSLTLLRISTNTTAVTDTNNIFIFPNDIGNLIDQHLNFTNLKIEIISISIRARIR